MTVRWRLIKSTYGQARVVFETPFGGTRIFSVPQTHTLVNAAGRSHRVFGGSIYVTNDELKRRTGGKVTDQLVPAGLYDVFRMCGHIENGAVREGEDLAVYIADVRGTADLLRVSGYMDEEMCAELLTRIAALSDDMGYPKRALTKATASTQLRTAERLRDFGGRRRIAPAARCAYSAAQHIARRLDNTVFGVNRYFSAQAVRVGRIIQQYEMVILRAWTFFVKAPTSGAQQTEGWDEQAKKLQRSGARQIRGAIQEHILAFEQLTLRPYRDLARLAIIYLRRLDAAFGIMDFTSANEHVNDLARTLRRMVLIRNLEHKLIGRVSRVVESRRLKRPEAFPTKEFCESFAEIAKRIGQLTEADLDPEVLLAIQLGFESAIAHLARKQPTDLKHCLKGIVEDLASVSFSGQRTLPFERAS